MSMAPVIGLYVRNKCWEIVKIHVGCIHKLVQCQKKKENHYGFSDSELWIKDACPCLVGIKFTWFYYQVCQENSAGERATNEVANIYLILRKLSMSKIYRRKRTFRPKSGYFVSLDIEEVFYFA